jgi:hypothetical protein
LIDDRLCDFVIEIKRAFFLPIITIIKRMSDNSLNDINQTAKYFAVGFAGASLVDTFYGVEPFSPMVMLQNAAASVVQTWIFDKYGGDAVLYALSRDKRSKPNYASDLAEGLGGALIGSALAGAAVRYFFFQMPFTPALVSSMAGSAGMFMWIYPIMRADL